MLLRNNKELKKVYFNENKNEYFYINYKPDIEIINTSKKDSDLKSTINEIDESAKKDIKQEQSKIKSLYLDLMLFVLIYILIDLLRMKIKV